MIFGQSGHVRQGSGLLPPCRTRPTPGCLEGSTDTSVEKALALVPFKSSRLKAFFAASTDGFTHPRKCTHACTHAREYGHVRTHCDTGEGVFVSQKTDGNERRLERANTPQKPVEEEKKCYCRDELYDASSQDVKCT